MRRLQFYSPKAVAQPVEPLETRPGLGDLRVEPVCEVARLLAVVCAQVDEAGQLALADVVQQLGLDALVGRLHQVQEAHLQGDDQLVEVADLRSEEHTSELQSLMRISYAVFCLKNKKTLKHNHDTN